MRILAIVLALLVWVALSYAFVFAFAGAHACTILQPVGSGPTATPIPVEVLTARCDRPAIGAIAASVGGLVAIVVVALAPRPGRSRRG